MDAIGTDNANKTVQFLLLIGLLVFCIYMYTLTFGPFSCCVLFTVSFNKRKSVIIIFLQLAGLSLVRTVCICIFYVYFMTEMFLQTFKLF